MVAAKQVTGGLVIATKGGNAIKVTKYYGGGGGGGIVLLYSHTTATWTGKVTMLPGTVSTEPAAAGKTGSKVVRKKYTGALYP